jgi:hypothetical protein
MPIRLPNAPAVYNQRDQIEMRRTLESLIAQVNDIANQTGAVQLQDEGTPVGNISILNAVGANITASVTGNTGVLTVTGSSGVATQDEGVPLGTATTLNFTGAGVTASGAPTTVVNIPGGGGSFTATKVTVTLPAPAKRNHRGITVTDAAVTATDKVDVWLHGVAETNVNTIETAECCGLGAVAAAGQFEFQADFLQPISGPLVIDYARAA